MRRRRRGEGWGGEGEGQRLKEERWGWAGERDEVCFSRGRGVRCWCLGALSLYWGVGMRDVGEG